MMCPVYMLCMNVYVLGIMTCILFVGHVHDVNRRYVLAINSTTTGKMFAAYLDLSAPVTSYNSHIQLIDSAAKEIAMKSKQRTVEEAKSHVGDSNLSVSVDDTWQRGGLASKSGVVTVLSNLGKDETNKVVDTEVLTTYCGTCSQRNRDNVLLSTIASVM